MPESEEMLALYAGVALYGSLVAFVTTIWNGAKLETADKKSKNVVGLILAILALLLFILYLVCRFVTRIHEKGAMVF